MNIIQTFIADEPIADRSEAPTEVYVLACVERYVKPSYLLERIALYRHVTSAEPRDLRPSGVMAAERVVKTLDPGCVWRRMVRRAYRTHPMVQKCLDCVRNPIWYDFVVRVDERQNLACGDLDTPIAELANAKTGKPQNCGTGLNRDEIGAISRAVVGDDDLKALSRVRAPRKTLQASPEPRGVISNGNDERD